MFRNRAYALKHYLSTNKQVYYYSIVFLLRHYSFYILLRQIKILYSIEHLSYKNPTFNKYTVILFLCRYIFKTLFFFFVVSRKFILFKMFDRDICKIILVVSLYWIIANFFIFQYYLNINYSNLSWRNTAANELVDTEVIKVETQIEDWSSQNDFLNDNISNMYQLHYLKSWQPVPLTTDIVSDGPGEGGRPVILNDSQKIEMGKRFKEHEFNIIASEMISLNRSLLDFRPLKCLTKRYPTLLPATSIIIVFYNEAWSTLLRTIWSIINRTPRSLVNEILLVDDGSILGKCIKNILNIYNVLYPRSYKTITKC